MKKSIGKLTGLLLAMVLMLGIAPQMAFAEEAPATESQYEPVTDEAGVDALIDRVRQTVEEHQGSPLSDEQEAELESFREEKVMELEREANPIMPLDTIELPRYEDLEKTEPKVQATIVGWADKQGFYQYTDAYIEHYGKCYPRGTAELYRNGRSAGVIDLDETNGRFSFELDDTWEAGTYTLRVKAPYFLTRYLEFEVVESTFHLTYNLTPFWPAWVAMGDMDNNGIIDINYDYDTFFQMYGQTNIQADSIYALFDYDGNGVLGMQDAGIFLQNRNFSWKDYVDPPAIENVISAETYEPLTVEYDTPFESLALPQTAAVTTDRGNALEYPIIWDETTYDPQQAEQPQTLRGSLDIPYIPTTGDRLMNQYQIPVEIVVNVKGENVDYIPQIVAGDEFIAGLSNTGELYGEGTLYRSGRQSIAVANTITEWNALAEEPVFTLYAGGNSLVGVSESGKVYAAGGVAMSGTNKAALEAITDAADVAVSQNMIAVLHKDHTITAVTNDATYDDMVTVLGSWTNIKTMAVSNKHAVAVTEESAGNAAKGYHISYGQVGDVDALGELSPLNITSWLNLDTVNVLAAGTRYTAGISDKTQSLRIKGAYENGQGIKIPNALSRNNTGIQKVRTHGDYIFAILASGKYAFIDTKKDCDDELYLPDSEFVWFHDVGAAASDQWTELTDIAMGNTFIAGLTKTGTVHTEGSATYLTEVAKWNLGETIQ